MHVQGSWYWKDPHLRLPKDQIHLVIGLFFSLLTPLACSRVLRTCGTLFKEQRLVGIAVFLRICWPCRVRMPPILGMFGQQHLCPAVTPSSFAFNLANTFASIVLATLSPTIISQHLH